MIYRRISMNRNGVINVFEFIIMKMFKYVMLNISYRKCIIRNINRISRFVISIGILSVFLIVLKFVLKELSICIELCY